MRVLRKWVIWISICKLCLNQRPLIVREEKAHYLIKDAGAKNKEERVRAHPLLSADDFYDEDKYRELLQKAAEELLEA